MIVHTQYLGNQELLKLQKTAFLASGNIASEEVLRVYVNLDRQETLNLDWLNRFYQTGRLFA